MRIVYRCDWYPLNLLLYMKSPTSRNQCLPWTFFHLVCPSWRMILREWYKMLELTCRCNHRSTITRIHSINVLHSFDRVRCSFSGAAPSVFQLLTTSVRMFYNSTFPAFFAAFLREICCGAKFWAPHRKQLFLLLVIPYTEMRSEFISILSSL